MNTIVCIKRIPDPEIPPSKFRLDVGSMRVIPPDGIPPVINPYDEQAVELALRIKDGNGGKVSVISLCEDGDAGIVKHAIAMGADEGVVITDEAFEGSDSFSTAYILSRAIRKIADCDLVLCGRQAADWDEGLVGSIIAAYLGLPLVTLTEAVDVTGGNLNVKRVTLDGRQVFSVPTPALVTVSSEVGQPRLPSGWGIISAARQDIPVWSAGDLDIDMSRVGTGAARKSLVELFIPERARQCEIIGGETADEASAALADRLVKEGVI